MTRQSDKGVPVRAHSGRVIHTVRCGYLYIAVGAGSLREAETSVLSLRRVDPQAHVTLITNEPVSDRPFDNVIIRPGSVRNFAEAMTYRVKHIYHDAPYDRTFFVDADTYFFESCRDLFRLLDYFDMCLAVSPADTEPALVEGKPLVGCTLYNCGVILFRRNEANEATFSQWLRIHRTRQRPDGNDQPALAQALLTSQSRLHVLDNTWNARIPFFITLNGPVKLVHGRHPDFGKLRRRINATMQHRCWDPVRQKCRYRRVSFWERFHLYRKVRARLRRRTR